MEKPSAPPFPFAGVTCMLMGGLLLMSGGFRIGPILIGFAIIWTAIALILKVRRS
jgi:hypothetical protein